MLLRCHALHPAAERKPQPPAASHLLPAAPPRFRFAGEPRRHACRRTPRQSRVSAQHFQHAAQRHFSVCRCFSSLQRRCAPQRAAGTPAFIRLNVFAIDELPPSCRRRHAFIFASRCRPPLLIAVQTATSKMLFAARRFLICAHEPLLFCSLDCHAAGPQPPRYAAAPMPRCRRRVSAPAAPPDISPRRRRRSLPIDIDAAERQATLFRAAAMPSAAPSCRFSACRRPAATPPCFAAHYDIRRVSIFAASLLHALRCHAILMSQVFAEAFSSTGAAA